MIVKIADWGFDVDIEANMVYSCQEAKNHCTCAFCRNFYKSVDIRYPMMRPFLAEFGIDIEAPDELKAQTATCYNIAFCVKGSVECCGADQILISDAAVDVQISPDEPGYFWLYFEAMEFPWTLDEPADSLEVKYTKFGDLPIS